MKKYKKIYSLVLASAAFGASQGAGAMPINAASDGYGLGLELEVLNINAEVVLPAGASGTAPAAYDKSASVVAADIGAASSLSSLIVSAAAGADSNTKILSGTAYSNVDSGLVGTGLTKASGGVDRLNVGVGLGLGGVLGGLTNIFQLNNVTLSSEAAVSGDYGAMSATGSSSILSGTLHLSGLLGATISGLLSDYPLGIAGYTLDLAAYAGAAPNTMIAPLLLNPLGIELTLNEQEKNCTDGVCSMEVNALHLDIDSAQLLGLGLNLLDTDLKLGHSYAEMAAKVPEPATFWLLAVGFASLVGFGRRQAGSSL